MSRRKRREKGSAKRKTGAKIARYECLGCGRRWGEDLDELVRMRADGRLPTTYSGTNCSCEHPYIRWTNYEELVPRLRKDRGRNDEDP